MELELLATRLDTESDVPEASAPGQALDAQARGQT